MPIVFTCPTCNHSFSVSDDLAGQTTSCNKCGSKLTIPGEVDTSSAPLEKSSQPEFGNPQQHPPKPRWVIALTLVCLMLILIGGVAGAYLMFHDTREQDNKVKLFELDLQEKETDRILSEAVKEVILQEKEEESAVHEILIAEIKKLHELPSIEMERLAQEKEIAENKRHTDSMSRIEKYPEAVQIYSEAVKKKVRDEIKKELNLHEKCLAKINSLKKYACVETFLQAMEEEFAEDERHADAMKRILISPTVTPIAESSELKEARRRWFENKRKPIREEEKRLRGGEKQTRQEEEERLRVERTKMIEEEQKRLETQKRNDTKTPGQSGNE